MPKNVDTVTELDSGLSYYIWKKGECLYFFEMWRSILISELLENEKKILVRKMIIDNISHFEIVGNEISEIVETGVVEYIALLTKTINTNSDLRKFNKEDYIVFSKLIPQKEKEPTNVAADYYKKEGYLMSNEIKCPMCGSTQLSSNQKGFSLKNATGGALLLGPLGLLGGLAGSGKVQITCLNCGHVFKPGEGR
jgi:tellurium resistance protein TerD